MVPDDLAPRWRDLAMLGWVATRQLGGPVVRMPVIGRLACAATWPVMMTSLVGAWANHALAAHGRVALVTVRACEPPDAIRWRGLLATTATLPAAMVALCAPLLAADAAAVAIAAAGWPGLGDALITVGLAGLAVVLVLMLAGTVPAVRITPLQRRAARALARQRGHVLIEANNLAADDPQRRAATVLVRDLRRHADARQVAILANPRDTAVARMYSRLGFEPLDVNRAGMLVRWPKQRPSLDTGHGR
jgi:hypothetical protein